MADAGLLQKVETLLRAAERGGFGLLEYSEEALQLRVAFEAGASREAAAAESVDVPVRTAKAPEVDAIVSPGVGFLRCSHPSGGKFPDTGDAIAAGAVVALIQAGPLFQPVAAPRAGRLGRLLVAEGTGVGFGTALFEFA